MASAPIIAPAMRLVIALLAVGSVGFSRIARAEPPTLDFRAPPSCPDEAYVERALGDVAQPQTQDSVRHVRARIREVQAGYEMELTLQTARSKHQKQLSATRCSTLVEVLRLEVGFSSVPKADSAAAAPAPAESPAHAPQALTWGTRLSGTVAMGSLPPPSGVLTLSWFLRMRRAQIEAGFGYGLPRELRYVQVPKVGGRFDLFSGEVRGCYVALERRISLLLCGGGELAGLRGRGIGLPKSFAETRTWIAVTAGPAVQFPIAGRVSGWVEAVGFAGVRRPAYGVRNLPTLYRPDRWGVRGALGLSCSF